MIRENGRCECIAFLLAPFINQVRFYSLFAKKQAVPHFIGGQPVFSGSGVTEFISLPTYRLYPEVRQTYGISFWRKLPLFVPLQLHRR